MEKIKHSNHITKEDLETLLYAALWKCDECCLSSCDECDLLPILKKYNMEME